MRHSKTSFLGRRVPAEKPKRACDLGTCVVNATVHKTDYEHFFRVLPDVGLAPSAGSRDLLLHPPAPWALSQTGAAQKELGWGERDGAGREGLWLEGRVLDDRPHVWRLVRGLPLVAPYCAILREY